VAVIYLDRRLPDGSSGLPGGTAGHRIAPLCGLAPGGVCWDAGCRQPTGALLPRPSTL